MNKVTTAILLLLLIAQGYVNYKINQTQQAMVGLVYVMQSGMTMSEVSDYVKKQESIKRGDVTSNVYNTPLWVNASKGA